METKEKILDTLKNSDAPLKVSQIIEQTGLDKKDVDKAMKELKKEGLLESPKACFYTAK